ncbi:MAG: rhodanese-like domain-containing protein [Ferruginibacter sp.]
MKIAITILATLLFSLSILFALQKHSIKKNPNYLFKKVYQCLPCGRSCDKQTYIKPGKCSQCHMDLVKKSTVTFKTIEPSELCKYISSNKKVILLDVRTKEEFEEKADPNFGVLKNAINIPIQELQSRLATLSSYKSQEIIVYCSHSHRSPQASYILTNNGFTNVTNLARGISELKDTSCKK